LGKADIPANPLNNAVAIGRFTPKSGHSVQYSRLSPPLL
jgi:hypothetical protein